MKSVFSGGFDYSGFARRRITPPASPRASWTRVGASFEDDEFTSGRGGDSIHGADVGSSSNAFGDQQQVRRSSSPREPVPQQQDSQQALGGNGNGGNGSGKMTSSGILIGSSSRAYVTAAGGGAAAVNDAREQEKEAALLQGGSLPSPREPLLPSPRSRPGGSLISLSKYYLAFLVVGASANSFGPMLPHIAHRVGVSTVDVGPLVQAGALGGLAGSALCPLLPLKALLPGGLLGLAASLVAVPHAASLTDMSLALASASICFQAVSVGAHTFVAREAGPQSTGLHINGINAVFGAGSFVAPALHEALAPHLPVWFGNTLASYWVVAAGAGVAAIPFLLGATGGAKDRAAAAKARTEGAKGAGLPVVGAGGGTAAASGKGGKEAAAAQIPLPPGTVHLREAAVPLIFTMALVASVAGYEACYAAWLFTFCREGPLHLASSAAAGYVSLFWAALTAGRVAAAGAAAQLPPHAVLLSSLPLAVLGPAAIVIWPGNSLALTAGLFACGFGISAGFANSVSMLGRVTPVSPTTQSMMQLSAAGGALTIAPLMLTLAKGELGPMALPLVTGTFGAGAIALVLLTHGAAGHVLRGARKKAAGTDFGV